MKLSRKSDQIISSVVAISLAVVFFVLVGLFSRQTFAQGNGSFSIGEAKYVTLYDDGDKLIIKTSATTVGEVLERAGVSLNMGDIVEPEISTEINADNYYINVYRSHPVVIRDGMSNKYLMTASYDAKTIAKEAGFTVYDGDELKRVSNGNFLELGVANVYELVRNGGRMITVEEEIPFEEETVKSYSIEPGMQEVQQLGELGLKRINYNVQYIDGVEVSRELVGEEVVKEPIARVVAVGTSRIEMNPLTPSRGVNRYTVTVNGVTVERKETYYDLPMSGVMSLVSRACGVPAVYYVRDDGVKVDSDGYVLVAAHLGRYPRCSVVETSLGPGKVYDTGAFAESNAEQFDIATDWTIRDGK